MRTGILAVAVTAAALLGAVLFSGSGPPDEENEGMEDEDASVVRFHLR